MIYIDTSCLLKLLIEEPESADVREAVASEETVIVSALAELETEVQLKSLYLGGILRLSQWRQYQARFTALRNIDPFHFRGLSGGVFLSALRQQRRPDAHYCRSLDRLHLAAMEELKVTRLLTHDREQADAGRAIGFDVVCPGF
ncbi:MAG: type II toxin-antitoxin system VapC family toxin [Verrucomicrobiota bacterium]